MNGTLPRRTRTRRCVIRRNGAVYEEMYERDELDNAVALLIRYAQCDRAATWELYKRDGSLWAAFRPKPDWSK